MFIPFQEQWATLIPKKQGYSSDFGASSEHGTICAGCMLPFRPWRKGRVQPWQTRGKCTWCCCWCLVLRIGRIVTSEYASCFDVFVGMLIASLQHPTMHQKSSEYGMDVDSYSPGGTIAPTCWDLSGREHPLAHHASKKPNRSQTRDPSTPVSRKS